MKRLSPIEMMVDKACGFDREAYEKTVVTLKCPACKRTKRVQPAKSDPKGTKTIELTCPDCWTEGTFEIPFFFDAKGKEIR